MRPKSVSADSNTPLIFHSFDVSFIITTTSVCTRSQSQPKALLWLNTVVELNLLLLLIPMSSPWDRSGQPLNETGYVVMPSGDYDDSGSTDSTPLFNFIKQHTWTEPINRLCVPINL